MRIRRLKPFYSLLSGMVVIAISSGLTAQSTSSSSSSSKTRKHARGASDGIDTGSIANGVYRNKSLGFTCKIPDGWVLRTEELNAVDEDGAAQAQQDQPQTAQKNAEEKQSARVLLAAFSRPPEARAEDVNASILIAVEDPATYPGLKDAAQYLELVEEVAKKQGFESTEEPYEFRIGAKTLPREDFEKNVGTRVMRQATLVTLERGYAISFNLIGGTEDERDQLVAGLEFQEPSRASVPTK